MSVKVRIGDIFESECSTLVNTVNCVGVMGKGIAAEFKSRFPEMYQDYKVRCDLKQVRVGEPYLYTDNFGNSILNFPTKDHWRSPSRLADIDRGLNILADRYQEWGIESIALPPLGCGNGGLEWSIVGPLMYQRLAELDIRIEVYALYGTSPKQLSHEFLSQSRNVDLSVKGVRNRKVTPGLVAILEVIDRLQQQPYANPVGRTIFQKICYIMTEQKIDTGMTFKRGDYGPFSSDAKEAISLFANMNVISESQLGKMNAIRTTDTYTDLRKKHARELAALEGKIDKAVDLFARIKNTTQAEEVATVLFSARDIKSRKEGAVSEQELCDYVMNWKSDWQNATKRKSIADAIRNLEMLAWVKLDYSSSLTNETPSEP